LRSKIIVLAALIQLILFSGKKEVSLYSEKIVEAGGPLVLDIFCDSGNIVTKRVRGTESEEILSQKLNNFNIDINENENKIIFKSEYKGKDKNPIEKLDIGNIKFYDDIKGVLNADIGD